MAVTYARQAVWEAAEHSANPQQRSHRRAEEDTLPGRWLLWQCGTVLPVSRLTHSFNMLINYLNINAFIKKKKKKIKK